MTPVALVIPAATGGLFGLGMGFSILSVAELLYFLLIRWIYYRHKAKKEQERRTQLSLPLDLAVAGTLNDNKMINSTKRSLRQYNPPSYNAWVAEQSQHL